LADSYVVVDKLVDVDENEQNAINSAVEEAINGLEPVKVTLATEILGEKGYDAVRIAPVGVEEHIQFWAKDTSGNWYDINVAGWGPGEGFELGDEYNDGVKTEIYILSDKVGTYDLHVKLVDVDNENAVIAEASGTVIIRDPQPSTYKFSVEEDALDNIVAGEEATIPVTFGVDKKYEEGYEGVRFKFNVDGPGTATFKAMDSEEKEYEAEDEGYWGPSGGFNIDAEYTATTPWMVTFSEAGEYTVTVSLIKST